MSKIATQKVVVVLGANGALGRAVSAKFASQDWKTILFDVHTTSSDVNRVWKIPPGSNAQEQYTFVRNTFLDSKISEEVLNAVVNVSGGFRLDNEKSDDIFESLQAMYTSSFESSVLAAHLAGSCLAPGGLLVLPGAACVATPTPFALTYGAMKAGVHHLVKSLSKSSLADDGSSVVGIAPTMLDTPMNRLSMPDSDFSSWTKTEVVADQIFSWTQKLPISGTIFKIETNQNVTEFVPM